VIGLSQPNPYEIRFFFLPGLSGKTVGHRPTAGRNRSAQSPLTLPRTHRRKVPFLDSFSQILSKLTPPRNAAAGAAGQNPAIRDTAGAASPPMRLPGSNG
jgi:hypothetical protein